MDCGELRRIMQAGGIPLKLPSRTTDPLTPSSESEQCETLLFNAQLGA